MKEKRDLLAKRFSSMGGFQPRASASFSKNKAVEIIKAPNGNPDEIVDIIRSQTIIKKENKKKPKKINFED